MTLTGTILIVVMIVAGLAWLGAPLLRANAKSKRELTRHERLLLAYERTLAIVRDLDEDHATGKIDDALYEIERAPMVEAGMRLLQALDAEPGQQPRPASAPRNDNADVLDDAEALIARYRASHASA